MKRENFAKAKSFIERLDYLERRIGYLQSKSLESPEFYIVFKGKVPGKDRFEFNSELGHMKGYVVAQTIQKFQKEKADIEKELALL